MLINFRKRQNLTGLSKISFPRHAVASSLVAALFIIRGGKMR